MKLRYGAGWASLGEGSRAQLGVGIPVVIVSSLVVVLIGIFIVFLLMQLGGGREAQHAVDAGNLNVAKRALVRPGIGLNPGVEQENFANLVDSTTGEINLRAYNRVVGQALLVALNAAEDPGVGGQARTNAQRVLAAAQGPGGIGERLFNTLAAPGGTRTHFEEVARPNLVSMLGTDTQVRANDGEYDTSFMARGAPSNVFLNTADLNNVLTQAQRDQLGSVFTQRGDRSFINGYQDIPALGTTLQFVTLRPTQAPHLVSLRDFNTNRDSPLGAGNNVLPQNAFRSSGFARDKNSSQDLKLSSTAIVGALDSVYRISLPFGYIEVENPQGTRTNFISSPNPDHVIANELGDPNGISVVGLGGDRQLFSTNGDLIAQWATYNEGGGVGTPPTTSELYVVDSLSGTPRQATTSDAALITSTRPTTCVDRNVSGSTAISPCQELYGPNGTGPFAQIYSPGEEPNEQVPSGGIDLMAVEELKRMLIDLFNIPGTLTAPPGSTGLRVFTCNPTVLNCCAVGGAASHSIDLGTRSAILPVVSVAGSPAQLLRQADGNYDQQDRCSDTTRAESVALRDLRGELRRRIRQIKPEASDAEINAVLASATILMGETKYIYMEDPEGARRLVFTDVRPPAFSGVNPDGSQRIRVASTYPLRDRTVNPRNETNIHDQLYTETIESATLEGTDSAEFIRSSGFRNLLGRLTFRNQAQGEAFFTRPD